MTVAVNMPQMAANGLSENWLFKFCGDLHWQMLCRSLDTPSSRLVSEAGDRLYPSFVAISARYSEPLSAFGENDALEESIDLRRYGTSFFHGLARLARGDTTLELEMITAFVSRSAAGRNDLRKAGPAASFAFSGVMESAPPPLLTKSAQLRKRAVATYSIGGFDVDLSAPALALDERYQPSPYVDYNGANLLYYAAYPSIIDAGERRILTREGRLPDPARDWAMTTSTLARDIFYYRNLDLGENVVVSIEHLHHGEGRVMLHSILRRELDREPIAEAFTVKKLVP